MRRQRLSLEIGTIGLVLGLSTSTYGADNNIFPMVRSSTAVTAGCLANAKGRVTISPLGPVENMHVEVSGLPPNAGFDLFVIQLPDKPFGLSWYQGDIHTDSKGTGVGDFTGRFSFDCDFVAKLEQGSGK
jgi:hypothetical protein